MKESNRKIRTKRSKKGMRRKFLRYFVRFLIVFCFITSIYCLFKHKQTIKEQPSNTLYNITQSNVSKDVIEKIQNGEIKISQNVPIPDELQLKMKKEAEEKRIAEEQARIEAEKKAEEERKKQEAIKIAQSKKVTTRGSTSSRQETEKATGSKAEYQAYAKDLCLNIYGWSENDFNCLVKLWNRESNWNPLAKNKSSGAYGICQSLPASKMASEGSDYLTNYKTQIRWGCKYIKNRYGAPANAWSHSQQKGWY